MNSNYLVAGALLLASAVAASEPVVEERNWQETYAVAAAPRLEIGNIWGSVQVRVGAPGRITVTVSERRSAPDQARFERSLEEYPLDILADEAGVSMIVGRRENRWQGPNHCRDCRVDYQFEVEVPAATTVDVSTVVDGRISISDVEGPVSAGNVNGPVRIDRVRDCVAINSVNGEVAVRFQAPPNRDCEIETINGDITLLMPGHAGLELAMDLFNGKAASEFPVQPLALPATVTQSVDEGRVRYRIQQPAGLRIGAGGPTYRVKSMNGDLRIGRL